MDVELDALYSVVRARIQVMYRQAARSVPGFDVALRSWLLFTGAGDAREPAWGCGLLFAGAGCSEEAQAADQLAPRAAWTRGDESGEF